MAWYTRQVNRPPNDRLSVLTWQVHERYQSGQSGCNAEFYLLNSRERPHQWNERNCQIPKNLHQIPGIQYGQETTYDLLLSHTNEQCFGDGQKIAATFDLPHIKLEHCLKSATGTNYADRYWKKFWEDCPANHKVFVTHFQRKDWLAEDVPNTTVILHGVDDKIFHSHNPKNKGVLIVANDLLTRAFILGFDVIEQVCDKLPVKFVGCSKRSDGSVFSEPASSLEDLASYYRDYTCYLNTTRLSTISTSCLEAACTGMPVFTINAPSLADYFNHEEHMMFSDDPKVLREWAVDCLENPAKYRDMGMRCRSQIQKLFGVERHCQEWTSLFHKVINEKINPKYSTNKLKDFFKD